MVSDVEARRDVILSTPNNESIRSLMALLLRGHYVAFLDCCYPAHIITAVLRKDLVRILTDAGFSRRTLPLHQLRELAKITSSELAASLFGTA